PLRRWRLIEVGSGDLLTMSQLRIDERVLHYLAGIACLDARLHGLVEFVAPPSELPPSHRELAQRMAGFWSRSKEAPAEFIINGCGDKHAAKRGLAAFTCTALGLQLHAVRATDIPVAVAEREALSRLWERESALGGRALLLDVDTSDISPGVLAFLENVRGM